MELSPPARRILGALVEKELATPQGYPLSINALRTAANQSTNRDPVVEYDETVVRQALQELSGHDLVVTAYAARSNTPKYAHKLGDHLEIGQAEVAVLAVLMLRGPQTVGELRQRTERLHGFAELTDVLQALEALRDHPFGALTVEMPRQPGQKEIRWRHLLDGVPAEDVPEQPVSSPAGRPSGGGVSANELAALREEVSELRDDVATLQAEVERLRRYVGG